MFYFYEILLAVLTLVEYRNMEKLLIMAAHYEHLLIFIFNMN